MVWKYHFARGINQKNTLGKIDYSQYVFTILDSLKLSYCKIHHGRKEEENPVTLSLHSYSITYTYEYQEPMLRMSAAGKAKATDMKATEVIKSMELL